MSYRFQSTLPVGGATYKIEQLQQLYDTFQSTLPVGGATDDAARGDGRDQISIHAPRGGSDVKRDVLSVRKGISIHAPRGGSDGNQFCNNAVIVHFNPRSPWGERPNIGSRRPYHIPNFNPRSPWGERQE